MIEEAATIVSCRGDYAEVETERREACGSCAVGQGCGAALLARVFGSRSSRLRVDNPIQAAPGDRVIVGVPESGVVAASMVLYLTPLLGLILFASLGQLGAAWSGVEADEWPSVLAGLLGLASGLLVARYLGRSDRFLRRARPVILRRQVSAGFAVWRDGPARAS